MDMHRFYHEDSESIFDLSLELVFELRCTSLFATNSHGRFAHRFLKPIRENQ